MILPPHSSHLTQPLDVGVFGPLKRYMAADIDPIIRTGVSRIQKMEWLIAFVNAHTKAMCPRNIQSGFRGTGIYPYNPSKVYNRVADTSSNSNQKTLSTTPPISPTLFSDNILNSSPIYFNAIHEANIELNAQLESYNEISPRWKKYINCPTRTVEQQHAANSVYRQEIKEQGEVLSGRKHKLSGKR